jgi:hypothetical protein
MAVGNNTAKNIVDDGTDIWMGLQLSPARIIQISKANPLVQATFIMPANYNICRGLVDDGTYIWMALSTTGVVNPRLCKMLKVAPNTITGYAFAGVGDDSSYTLAADADNADVLWVGMNLSPARLVKFTKSTGATVTTTFAVGENIITSIVDDGAGYLWIGLATSPAKLLKFKKADGTYTTYTFVASEDKIYALLIDDSHLWAMLQTTPTKLVHILMANPDVRSTYNFAAGENSCSIIEGDGAYIYTAVPSAATLIRVYKNMVDWVEGSVP